MSVDREPVGNALLALLTASNMFQASGRRFSTYSDAKVYPALFLRDGDLHYLPREVPGLPPRVVMDYEAWVYGPKSDVTTVPATALNGLITAVDAALTPGPIVEVINLGLTRVKHCWIEGTVVEDTGEYSGQPRAMIPIKVLYV